MSKSGESVYYTYNEDGLRVQKVTTTTGTTKYTLHGKNITHLENGSNSLHFFYDAQNKPAIVQYNGVNYAYLYNLQGDVIALVNSAGAKVVEYTYDAWGKLTSKIGSMASSLGTLSPFRYRGYVYDEETGLYYLRSRYYNSDKGRFLNADSVIMKPLQLHETNLFVYCTNRVISKADTAGTDAYWLTDSSNVFSLGHTSLLLENSDGTWYYFYWGPLEDTVPLRTQANVIVKEIPIALQNDGFLDLNTLNHTLNAKGTTNVTYEGTYDMATLYRGDYSRSVNYALLLQKTYTDSVFDKVPAYGVLFSNCLQASAAVMQASNPILENPCVFLIFQLAATYTIPSFVGKLKKNIGMPTVTVPPGKPSLYISD